MRTPLIVASAAVLCVAATRFVSGQTVDPVLLNNSSNGAGDEPPGMTSSVSASSVIYGFDDPREAFGRQAGPVESGTFIFGDNLPQFTIHTLDFTTLSPVFLTGLQVIGGGNTPDQRDPRRILSLSFAADLDNNGSFETLLFSDPDFADIGDGGTGTEQYSFAGITASSFRLSVQQQDPVGPEAGGGPRLIEVNAVVPEPGSFALLAAGLVGLWVLCRSRPKIAN